INFEIMAAIKNAPEALGLFRTPHHDKHPLEGLRWGLCHHVNYEVGYIRRFDVDETHKLHYTQQKVYE
ncbi:MAG: glycosyl hydrolase, partial [Planctomycetota bacterium]